MLSARRLHRSHWCLRSFGTCSTVITCWCSDSRALRPEAYTEIGNLFLASDYARTYTDLATMEAANEAARRATNAIVAVAGVDAPPCEFWEFDVPRPMRYAQLLDRVRMKMGLPNLILAATP